MQQCTYPKRFKWRSLFAGAVISSALVLAGCGSDDDDEGSSSTPELEQVIFSFAGPINGLCYTTFEKRGNKLKVIAQGVTGTDSNTGSSLENGSIVLPDSQTENRFTELFVGDCTKSTEFFAVLGRVNHMDLVSTAANKHRLYLEDGRLVSLTSAGDLTPNPEDTGSGLIEQDYRGNVGVLLNLLLSESDGVTEISAETHQKVSEALATAGSSLLLNLSDAFFRNQVAFTTLTDLLGKAAISQDEALVLERYNYKQGQSSTIAYCEADGSEFLVVPAKDADHVRVFDVSNGGITAIGDPITVGDEPSFVDVSSVCDYAYVGNRASGTVSVIDLSLAQPAVIKEITVGTEPAGLVLTPNNRYLFVNNFTRGDVSVINTTSLSVIGEVALVDSSAAFSPWAMAITNDGDEDDLDETVYVTDFFMQKVESIPLTNTSGQGIIKSFNVGVAIQPGAPLISVITLPSFPSGFGTDRSDFCEDTRLAKEADPGFAGYFNPAAPPGPGGANAIASEVFCDENGSGDITNVPQNVLVNQLNSLMLLGPYAFTVAEGASPEPPVDFNTNVQALVTTTKVLTGTYSSLDNPNMNLNNQIKTEVSTDGLNKLFGNSVVAQDADLFGNTMLVVSRGGDYVIRGAVDQHGIFNINAPDNVIRFATGHIPTGVVMDVHGDRAFTNNEVNQSVSVLDLTTNTTAQLNVEVFPVPLPGTEEYDIAVGKLAFFTALGLDDNGEDNTGLFDIDTHGNRNKASDNAWSSCASCHPDGWSDGITWSFATGPRQTIPMDGSYSPREEDTQRIFNWNAVRSSVTDFNNNSRGVQGGIGWVTDIDGVNRTAEIFNHGPEEINPAGGDSTLTKMQDWARTVRSPIMPGAGDLTIPTTASAESVTLGRDIFGSFCVDCHAGTMWTTSQVRRGLDFDGDTTAMYLFNVDGAIFPENPLGANFPVAPIDPDLATGGPQLISVEKNAIRLTFLFDVGTAGQAGQLDIRGAGAIAGFNTRAISALSAGGAFNVSSLLGTCFHRNYMHDGLQTTLTEVFAAHTLPATGLSITDSIADPASETALQQFLCTIDDNTIPFPRDVHPVSAFIDALSISGGVL